MKGIVFTEFLAMVGLQCSEDMVDDIIDDAALPHGGAYTAVGTYPFSEMVALIVALSKRTGVPVTELIHRFGYYLFGRFLSLYPDFITSQPNTINLLASIESIIHVEVRKLYPDAELPTFEVESKSPQALSLIYRSPRCLADLASGLIEGALHYYKETEQIKVGRELLDDAGNIVRFKLERV